MERSLNLALTALLLGALAAEPKTPAEVTADLAGIMPAGKKARLAWAQGGDIASYRLHNNGTTIYGLDSDDGQIHEITPTSLFTGGRRDTDEPHITADGTRVLFFEDLSGTVYVVNWDGKTGFRKIAIADFLYDYYFDEATKTDWAVVDADMMINIDNPGQQRAIYTGTQDVNVDDGFTVSGDGLYFAAFMGGQSLPCICKIPNGPQTWAFDASSNRGCVISIAPDNSHYFMHQDAPHVTLNLYKSDGTKWLFPDISHPVITWAKANGKMNTCYANKESYNLTRWTNDRNYITNWFEFTNCNPFIFRLSDLKYVHIQDATNCTFAGNMDVRFLDKGPASAAAPSAEPASRLAARSGNVYSVDGRVIEGRPRQSTAPAGPGMRAEETPRAGAHRATVAR